MRTCAGVVLAVFATTPFAYAETLVSTESKVEISPTMMRVDTQGGVKAEPVDVEARDEGGMMHMMETETEVKGEAGMHMMEGKPMDDDEHGLENAMMQADEHAEDGLLNADMHVNIHDLMESEGKEGHQDGAVEIDEADEVHSSADFEHFIAHKAKSDEHMKEVKLKDGKVEVTYALPVEFLGFWDTTLDTTVSADVSGNVEFDYPWYAIFMQKDFSKKSVTPILKSEIDAEIAAATSVDIESKGTTTVPTMKRTFAVPHVLESMMNAMGKVRAGWDLKENTK